MRTVRALLAIPVAALLIVACSGSDEADLTTVALTTATTTTVAGSTPEGTDAPMPTEAPADDEVMEGPAQIDVVIGVDSGPERIVRVRAGADLTLNITNPDAADEFHVHGIDLERSVEAGTMATFNFNVGDPGTIEVESHATDTVVVVIEVV